MALTFGIVRHPHFVRLEHWQVGAGGNIDITPENIFKHGDNGRPVKVKRISLWTIEDGNYITVKEGDENGAVITVLGRRLTGKCATCYFKDGGTDMRPFLDVSESFLMGSGGGGNYIIVDFDN